MRIYLSLFLFLCSNLFGDNKTKTLYNSLDPQSIVQHLAFYELFPQTQEGSDALKVAWQLMTGMENPNVPMAISSAPLAIGGLGSIVNRSSTEPPNFTAEQLQVIEQVGKRLLNRSLKGYYYRRESEILQLPPQEIDLARGVFISQLGESDLSFEKIRRYEAMLDLMALQIAARLSPNATPKEKIRQISKLVFEEMGYRFPPHSCYAKDIDVYTFLPSVLDSRRGVCLGVSILYLCLAQRLGLPLEMITPPGHIYVRYKSPNDEINIETTARGIHLDSEEYLSVNTRALQQRNIKEVIGLAHMNEAAAHWHKGLYSKALQSYQKASLYLPKDQSLIEFRGLNTVLSGNVPAGKALLEKVKDYVAEEEVTNNILVKEYLDGKIDEEGLKAIFMEVDETRESLLKKKDKLEASLVKYPYFSTGLFYLATVWLQLHREGEALELLERAHKLNPKDPTIQYYLSVLWMHRLDYEQAWIHLRLAEDLTSARNHNPKALIELRRHLARLSPE